jgi:hypothetical protein
MVDLDLSIKKYFDKVNIDKLFDNISYGYYYNDDYNIENVLKRNNHLNCFDNIYEEKSFVELVIFYIFTFERFISETDEYAKEVLENELKIIREYMDKVLEKDLE